MSGLLLTSDNIYGLVNPPPDPVNDLPELHQTIGSAGVRWDYFLDLSNNIGDHLIAGDNVTITGNVISVQTSTTSSTTDNSGSTVNTSNNVVVSRAQLTNVDLCNNRFIELTFNENITHVETYDLANFKVKKYGNNVGLGEIYIKDGKVNLSLDYSANIVVDGSSTHLINPNKISGQLYFETFNDTKHIGNFQTQGTFEAGVNNIGYSKKGVSGEGLFNLTTSHIPNGVKAISFWVKDYECLQETWFLVSDIVRLNGLAIELFVDSTNTLAGYGENLNKLYIDGNQHTLAARNSNLPFTLFDITPSLTSTSFNGWHHVYIEAKTTFADIELLSRNGENNSLGSLDEIRMYDRALTSIEISGLAIPPYLTTMDNLTEVEIKYTRDMGTKDNLKTGTSEEIQHFIYYNGTEYYIKDVLSYFKRVDLSLKQIVVDISDLSQNVNVRLEDLSRTMIESIVPVLTDVSLNEGIVELNFTKDIGNQTTYDISNFTIRYNDHTQNYNTIDIENGNVKIKNITESGGGTALLTSPNSSLHSIQTYNASTQQSSTSSTANKAFDGQLTGQASNTWKSSSNKYIIVINQDLSSQVYFEDFDDQDYSGNQTTASLVSGGIDGTGYALEGTTNSAGKVWWQSTNDIMPNNVIAISFWHYPVAKIADSNGDIPVIWCSNDSSSPTGLGLGMDLLGSNIKYYTTNQKGLKITKWYLNGVDTVDISENSAGYDFNTQHRYVDVSLNRWYHHYFEFNNTFSSSTINGIRWLGSSLNSSARYRGTGKLDEVRMFTNILSSVSITDLSNNTFPNPANLNEEEAGLYKGTELTQGYSGEWIQVNMGSSTNTKVHSFTIKPQQNTTSSIIDSHPKEFKMFASNDTTSWNEISHISDLSNDTWYYNNAFSNYTVNLSTPLQYQYWRLVVSKVINSDQVSIGELDFNGSIVTNNASLLTDVNKLEIAYRKDSDKTKNLVDLIGGGEINEFIYKGLGLTNINKERFTDLSDVSVNNIIEGQFVKYNNGYFVPTNDISDISQNLADEITRAIDKEANIDGAIATINSQLSALLTDAPTTLDTLKEIADVLGDPTDASGGIGTILNKLQDISNSLQNVSNQSSGAVGDLSGQTTQAISDLSTNVFDRIHTSNTNLTFFEIMTRQPSAFSPSGEVSSTAGDIVLNWTYDNILANSTNTTLAKLAFQNTLKSKNIPFIDNITLEISGNVSTGNSTYDNSSNLWITFTTGIWPKTFSNTEDYNSSTYKTLTINKISQEQANQNAINNILSKTDPFDVRIYGTNYAEDYPTIDNRSLYFYDLSFVTALVPSIPQFASENAINSDSSITFNFFVAETELNAPDSNGVLIDASNTYFDFETTSSSVGGIAITNTNIQTSTPISNVAKNTNYPITISNLRAGTKYKFSTAARNNLTSTTSYSGPSTTITSSFTRLPSSSGSTPTSSWFSVSTYAYRISTPTGGTWSGDNLNNSSVRYLNKANNDYLQLLNSNRTFEISLPYSSTQQNTQIGYGKFIDNSGNLTEISFSIDGTEKQELVYGGFGINPLRLNKNSNTVNYFSNPSVNDPYNGNNNRQGFRLNGTFSVQDILHSNIGIPSSSGYSLNYTFNKHSDVGGINISSTYKVYIDELTGNPNISLDGTETYVTALSYCMGIPSVETFDISFNRTYNNVNSQYQYVRYHTSSPAGITVGLINSVSKTNRSSSSYSGKINIDRTDISSNGIYSFNSTEIDSKTSNRFRDIFFTQTIGMPTSGNQSPSDSFIINEKSFNLNGEATTNTTQTFTYYCDYASFNKSGSKITTPIISIVNMGEIANMGVFNTQLNTISTTNITSHVNAINDWTLLFINGRFRSNVSQSYPNITGYTWTKPPGEGTFGTQLTYNKGSTAYYLNGSTTGTGNKYKWIAFKFTESDATTTTVSGIQYTYLNIYNLLSQNYYFTSTILGYLKNSSNNNVLGFIQQSYNGVSRIGNLSRGYSPSAIWYSQDAATTFNTIFEGANKSNYGCVFEQSSNSWGPILDTTNGDTNITIYIGFNNDVSLG